MKLIRSLITLTMLAALIYMAATVKLGQRTLIGHVSQIWAADETQDLVEGVKETSGPLMDKLGRGVKAGLEEANKEDASADETAADGS